MRTTSYVEGVGPDHETARHMEAEQGGRFISALDVAQKRRVVFLGNELAERLFGKGNSPIGRTVIIEGLPFVCVGVLKKKPLLGGGEDLRRVLEVGGKRRVDAPGRAHKEKEIRRFLAERRPQHELRQPFVEVRMPLGRVPVPRQHQALGEPGLELVGQAIPVAVDLREQARGRDHRRPDVDLDLLDAIPKN